MAGDTIRRDDDFVLAALRDVIASDEPAPPEPEAGPGFVEPMRDSELTRLFGSFCSRLDERLENCASKTTEWQAIAADYNAGRLVPRLLSLKGKRTERALRRWFEAYRNADFDSQALLHGNKALLRGRKVTGGEQAVLLNMLLTPRRVKIGSAITRLKQMAALNLVDSPSSTPTLKRWCQDWAITHPAEWGQAREGGKYVAEKVIKSIMRDQSLLQVGDVFVADGHVLAFDIINPETGKPQRMMLILVLDWASRYPVGAALATSENSQHICVAFRNAFLNWGGLPRFVYLDNGRAFRARLFHGDWQKHDLEDELGGIFPRLGVGVSFAKEYNAQTKVIERFFKTFQEQFERFVTSFRGSCVADQPATLRRNETWMRKLFAGQPPTVPEALQMMEQYFRLYYGQQPHAGLGGRKPFEVFSSAPVPTERVVEPEELNFLMLNVMSRKVNAEGITLHKLRYYDEKLVDYVGRRVNIRFDYGESRWIMVFDEHDKYICHAELRRTQHPFIHLDNDNPQSITGLRKELKQITRLRHRTRLSTRSFVKQAQEAVDLITAQAPLVQTETFSTAPLLPAAPAKPLDIERQGLEAFRLLKSNRVEAPEPPTTQPRSFDEMLKAIGIK